MGTPMVLAALCAIAALGRAAALPVRERDSVVGLFSRCVWVADRRGGPTARANRTRQGAALSRWSVCCAVVLLLLGAGQANAQTTVWTLESGSSFFDDSAATTEALTGTLTTQLTDIRSSVAMSLSLQNRVGLELSNLPSPPFQN